VYRAAYGNNCVMDERARVTPPWLDPVGRRALCEVVFNAGIGRRVSLASPKGFDMVVESQSTFGEH
jgi:hypothetical protein